MELKELFEIGISKKASDLHIMAGSPPTLRVDGNLFPLENAPVLTEENIRDFLKEVMTTEQLELLSVNKELDFSFSVSQKTRIRANVYTQRGLLAASFRFLPAEIPEIDSLGLPRIVHSLLGLKQGLILVTGPTGHGKSTSIAAMINEINKTRANHIVTIEDPIEFVFKPQKSIISQREMGADTLSWQIALRSVLREDPDVVLVGEMRDYETIASTITVAETGHLVFATLHTNSAAQTIDRIVDVFPEQQQAQIRLQLSNVIEAVISQRLLPSIGGGRVLACELMLGTSAIKTAIREGKTHQIDSILQTSVEAGMIPLERSLALLVKEGKVTLEEAKSWSLRPEELLRLVRTP